MNVKETDNSNSSEELIKREDIKGTPFTIIKDEKGYFLTVGKYKVSEYEGKKELINKVKEKDWELITTMIGIIAEYITEENN